MAGHTTGDINEQRTASELHVQDARPPPPLLSFREVWDALPPLPPAPTDRTRSLQMPVFFKEAAPAAVSAHLCPQCCLELFHGMHHKVCYGVAAGDGG